MEHEQFDAQEISTVQAWDDATCPHKAVQVPEMTIFNDAFRYTPSYATDIRKTIRREQKRLREAQALREALPKTEEKMLRRRAVARKP